MHLFSKKKAVRNVGVDKLTSDPAYGDVANSQLFSAQWYLHRYADVASSQVDPIDHYLSTGFREGRDPGPWFSTLAYFRANPDVERSGMNPLVHYIRHGKEEGREGHKFQARRQYDDLCGFLDWSTTEPVVAAPFDEPAMRAFAMMDVLAEKYALASKQLPSSRRPLVSIVMPVWNREGVVAHAIESVLTQTYERFELLIVDDGSDDGTEVVVRSFDDSRIVLLQNQTRSGVSRCRNDALSRATGEIVAYLDSDNTWLPKYLAANVMAFELNPDIDTMYSGQYVYQTSSTSPAAVRFGSMNVSLLDNRNYIDLNCLMHRSGLDHLIGGYFREDMTRLVDWELNIRLAARTKMMSLPIIQCNYFDGRVDNTITLTEEVGPALEAVANTSMRCKAGYSTPLMRASVAIIIVSYQAIDELRRCLQAALDFTNRAAVEIIVVDNNSSEQVTRYIRQMMSYGIVAEFLDQNFGFSYAVNRGVMLASPDADILLLNNDATLTAGALEQLQHVAYSEASVGITVPQQIVPAYNDSMRQHVPYADHHLPVDVTLSRHHQNLANTDLERTNEPFPVVFAPFFCAYIRREVWDACDGLDHRRGRHYRSDRIMCDFVRSVLKKQVLYVHRAIVHHQVQASTKALQDEVRAGGASYDEMLLSNRWPGDLADELGIIQAPWML